MRAAALFLVSIACAGCATHRPWRLANHNTTAILVPPDVARPDVARRKLRVAITPPHRDCPPATGPLDLRLRPKDALVTITRDTLSAQPRGWLGSWGFQLEEQCLAPGDGIKVAARVAEAVPLEPGAAFNLLYSDDKQTGIVDLGAHSALQVVSPLLRDPAVGIIADGPSTVTGSGYNLIVTGKFTDNLIGYETAFYAVERSANGIGHAIKPVHADRHIDGKVQRSAQPAINHFRFSSDAAFYRLIYKSWLTDFTALMIGARTPAELEQQTKMLEGDGTSASCEKLGGRCIPIPRAVAVHPMISVQMNGVISFVPRGATVLQALRRAGEGKPESLLSHLTVEKPWNGRLVLVKFDSTDAGILKLVLQGGETIRWK